MQLEELQTIGSIYEDEQFEFVKDPDGCYAGSYVAYPQLLPGGQGSVHLLVRVCATNKTSSLSPYRPSKLTKIDRLLYFEYEIHHPPPVTIQFSLPKEYPRTKIPIISLDCSWLPHNLRERSVEALEKFMNSRLGDSCLWDTFKYLEAALFSELLRLPQTEEGCVLYDLEAWTRQEALKFPFASVLVEYDVTVSRRQFRTELMECPVCAEDFLGTECLRLRTCFHVACRECLRSSLNVHLKGGAMAGDLHCLDCKAPVSVDEASAPNTTNDWSRFCPISNSLTLVVFCAHSYR